MKFAFYKKHKNNLSKQTNESLGHQDGPLMQLYNYFNDNAIIPISFGPSLWKMPIQFLILFWQIRLLFSEYLLHFLLTPWEAFMHVVLGHVTRFGMECGEVKMYQFQAKTFQAPHVLGNV